MRRFLRLVLPLLLALAQAGCGGSSGGTGVPTPEGSRVGPNGGNAVPLPGSKGFVELLSEQRAGAREPILVAYFYQADLKSPLTSLPTDLAVKIPEAPGGQAALKPAPTSGEAAASARLVSDPVPIDPDHFAGTLTGTMDGSSFSIPVTIGL